MAIDYDYTPNDTNPFEVATSFNDNLLDLSADEAGYGSLVNRSIASGLLKYYPYKFAFDQFYQLFGGMEDTPTGVQEWFEADMLFEFEAPMSTDSTGTGVINDGTYSPATSATVSVADADAGVFSEYSEIRYSTGSGWEHAYVTNKDTSNSGYVVLEIESIDGNNLDAAGGNNVLQHISSNLPQDLDYNPQPKQSNPKGYKTFVENYRKEVAMTRKMDTVNSNGGTVVDLINHYEQQLVDNFRAEREANTLLGAGAKTRKAMDNGDTVNFSAGIYEQIKANDSLTGDITATSQDAENKAVKDLIYKLMLKKFGGESGGPMRRDFFVSPTMQAKLDRAWEGKERFIGGTQNTIFVAGVAVNRVANSQGVMDISQVATWSAKHPLENGAIRGGDGAAVGMLIPMDEDHIVRVLQTGFGPTQTVFKQQGGDRVNYQRIESKEAASLRLIKHCAVVEDSDPTGTT